MICVVRHGTTDWNAKKITMGRKNIPLNDTGIKEANITKEKLIDYDYDFIVCSPLERAKQTANIINNGIDKEIIYDGRLIERSLGDLEGYPYTSDNDRLWDININTNDYNIETMEEFKNRVYSFMDEITNMYPDNNILIVTHGGVSALINCYVNNSLYDGPIANKFLKNCSIANYEINNKHKSL